LIGKSSNNTKRGNVHRKGSLPHATRRLYEKLTKKWMSITRKMNRQKGESKFGTRLETLSKKEK